MSATTQWEYRTLVINQRMWGNYKSDDFDAQLVRLGMQGWELVNTVAAGFSFLMFLKRPR
ncbi:DUF4177 domain-containing protein [Dokdonella sp.]|uniref:DUF4177 domain-containing protein n=1 Tax=Dokdonella sp. TaxID=2291710 RepID=UPI0025BDA167|nr:DUF4177 domain-containing protein [Dokdonella sp.]MBX3692626.1 DUF4177 domain-containing protein [Dokdonella sp.]MCW5567370.1 DUF4177 domain-containing protein [Dokdonella sp.]